jgi:16S rRNA A1518/A1519 N6-dimethyltransferase RsmA/KsgA/DIM1 with predicted DNA glycosylase/AP lyase activity
VPDIGAGPGTLAIPLAPRVKEITAVEPGAGMVSILQERAAREDMAEEIKGLMSPGSFSNSRG